MPTPEFHVGDQVMIDARYLNTERPNKSLDHKNLGPYIIQKIHNNTAFELNLPESLSSIFPIFHPWLLHLANDSPLPGQRRETQPPGSIEEEGGDGQNEGEGSVGSRG